MGEVEGGRVVELGGLLGDRRHNRIAVVAGIGAPQAGKPVEHGAAIGREIMHALGAGDEPRRAFEGTIGGEGDPKGSRLLGTWVSCVVGAVVMRKFPSYLRHDRPLAEGEAFGPAASLPEKPE